jgi:hypothetical protein
MICQRALWVSGAKLRWRWLVVEGIGDVGFGNAPEVVGWVGIILVVQLFQQRLLPPFLLTEDLDIILELRESCSLYAYMLPSGFGSLRCGLSTRDDFLMKALYLLLDPGQLYFCYDFIF